VGEAIGALKIKSCIIDGEIAVCRPDRVTCFNLLRSGGRIKPDAILYAFQRLSQTLLAAGGTQVRILLRGSTTGRLTLDKVAISQPAVGPRTDRAGVSMYSDSGTRISRRRIDGVLRHGTSDDIAALSLAPPGW